MILTKIILHNFGVYAGRHEIDLSPKPDRPVILFGALNGSGKTTLLEGVQFALFGKSARFLPKGKSGYIDFLTNTVNRRYLQDSASVAVEFLAKRGGKRSRYTVVRTWSIRSNGGHEKPVQVFRDDELDEELSDRWEELSETFFPSALSELFFFDGERIEALAQPALCAQLIRTGLNTLLGLDLVSDLSKTIVLLERRLKSESVTTSEKQALMRAQDRLDLLKEQRQGLDQELSEKTQALSYAEQELLEAQDSLKLNGGELFQKREAIKTMELELITALSADRDRLLQLASDNTPLLLVIGLIEELNEMAKQGLTLDQREAVEEALLLFSKTILQEAITRKLFNDAQLSMLTQLQNQYISSTATQNSIPSISLPKGVISRIRSGLSQTRSYALAALLDFTKHSSELESVQVKLIAVPDEQKVAPLVNTVNEIESRVRVLRDEISVLDSQRNRVDFEAKQAASALQKLDAAVSDKRSEETRGAVMHSRLESSKKILKVFEDRIRNRHIAHLEKHIKVGYELLNRKRAFIKSVLIDPDTCMLRLNIVGDGVVPATKLSAAERQLLAVAVLWSLARMSGRKLPTIVDTPMGRLDSKNRKKVIENYFPVAGDQVILLSTDEEIVGSYYRSLRKHIANEYVIEYDDDSQSSCVNKGYFENAREAA